MKDRNNSSAQGKTESVTDRQSSVSLENARTPAQYMTRIAARTYTRNHHIELFLTHHHRPHAVAASTDSWRQTDKLNG